MWDLISHIASKKWPEIASGFMEGLNEARGPAREVLEELRLWATHLSRNALVRWPQIVMTGSRCEIPPVRGSEPCDGRAMVACDACGALCCLAHARVDYRAGGTCAVCVGEQITEKTRANWQWEDPPPRERAKGGKQQQRAKRMHADIDAAFDVLGLDPDATWEEVQTRHREKARELHPDRAKSQRERERRNKRMSRVNAAFETLKKHFQEAA